jgi:hypothetical protein
LLLALCVCRLNYHLHCLVWASQHRFVRRIDLKCGVRCPDLVHAGLTKCNFALLSFDLSLQATSRAPHDRIDSMYGAHPKVSNQMDRNFVSLGSGFQKAWYAAPSLLSPPAHRSFRIQQIKIHVSHLSSFSVMSISSARTREVHSTSASKRPRLPNTSIT